MLLGRARPRDAAESDVAGRGVDRLTLAGGGTEPQAVARGAQVRAALDHTAGDVRARFAGDQALSGVVHAGVLRDTAGLGGVDRVLVPEVVAGPLPYVPGHVVQTV